MWSSKMASHHGTILVPLILKTQNSFHVVEVCAALRLDWIRPPCCCLSDFPQFSWLCLLSLVPANPSHLVGMLSHVSFLTDVFFPWLFFLIAASLVLSKFQSMTSIFQSQLRSNFLSRFNSSCVAPGSTGCLCSAILALPEPDTPSRICVLFQKFFHILA